MLIKDSANKFFYKALPSDETLLPLAFEPGSINEVNIRAIDAILLKHYQEFLSQPGLPQMTIPSSLEEAEVFLGVLQTEKEICKANKMLADFRFK